jgi:hypothetical protein
MKFVILCTYLGPAMFLLYHSDRCNTSETVFHWCYVNDLHTTHAVVCWVTTGFHPAESLRSQNNAFNQTIIRHNQLSPDLRFSSWQEDYELLVCSHPHLHAAAPSHKLPSQFLIANKTQITIASPQILANDILRQYHGTRKRAPWY